MAGTKKYVVQTSDLVFISEVDRDKLLETGDFVAPSYGYYSIIQTIHRDSTVGTPSNIILNKTNIWYEIPYSFLMYYNHDKWYICDRFFYEPNPPKFRLISIRHNIFSRELDVTFTQDDNIHDYDHAYTCTDEILRSQLIMVNEIKITVTYQIINQKSIQTITKTFVYPKTYFFERIEAKGTASFSTNIIDNTFSKRPPGNVRYDANDEIVNPNIDTSTYGNHSNIFLNKMSGTIPVYILSYHLDSTGDNYIVHESYDHNNSNAALIHLKHNFCQSYLDVDYELSRDNLQWYKVTTIPRSEFESSIASIDYLIVKVDFMYMTTKSSSELVYRYPTEPPYESYFDTITDTIDGYLPTQASISNNLTFNNLVIFERFRDDIINSTIENPTYETIHIYLSRIIHREIPQRT